MKAIKDNACLPARLYSDKICALREKVQGWIILESFKNDKMALVILEGKNMKQNEMR